MNAEKKNIFLVDGNITSLTVGRNALAGRYNVLTMNFGEHLLKALEKNIPDLILLDIEIPDMSGYDIIKIIKNRPQAEHVPVIFLASKSNEKDEIEGLSLGAADYIFKPFSSPLLLKRIELHLELADLNNNLQEMVKIKTKSVELQNALLGTMAELVEYRDKITGGHIERTTGYLGILLRAMIRQGLYKEKTAAWNIDLLLQSAQLHDVGKIAIRDGILQKAGKLTAEEFEDIKKHTVFGKEVLDNIKKNTTEQSFMEYAGIFAETHHEKWDGSGYPKGLKGKEIPLEGRLMAIADVYDALVSERSYKKAFTHEEAVKIIKDDSGKHFDPDLVDLFVSVADEFNKANLEFGEH
jgi:putative two-component system response regulator